MECAGNGRALLPGPRPVSQPWLAEAVGTAAWRGTPLAPLLDEAGTLDGAREVVFTGLDRGYEGGEEQVFERSLPLEEALRDDVLLAYEMNGAPLLPQHGFPLRLVVPGWYGMTHVKWLTRITVVDDALHRLPAGARVPVPPRRGGRGRAAHPDRAARADGAAGAPGLPYPRAHAPRRPVHDRGPGVVRPRSDRDGRIRRGRGVGAGRARRTDGPLGLARLAAPSGTQSPATTSSPAAPATRPATPSRTRRTGTSAATPTTACSACRFASSRRAARRASRRACRRGSSPPCRPTPRGRPSRPRTRSRGTCSDRSAARSSPGSRFLNAEPSLTTTYSVPVSFSAF